MAYSLRLREWWWSEHRRDQNPIVWYRGSRRTIYFWKANNDAIAVGIGNDVTHFISEPEMFA